MVSESSTHLERSSRRFAARAGVAVWLHRTEFPHLTVAFAILSSGAVGLGASTALHEWGVTSMGFRFPLALLAAYVTFLTLIGFWVARVARRLEDWEQSIRREAHLREQHNPHREPELGEWIDEAVDSMDDANPELDEPQAVPAAFLLLLAGTIVLVCVYFVWAAPAFLSEVLVEGALVTWLYKPPQWDAPPNWFRVAFERTAAPALMMGFCLAAIGFGCETYAPDATTIVEFARQIAAQ